MTAQDLADRLRDGDGTLTAIECLIALAYINYPHTCRLAVTELEALREQAKATPHE